MGRGALLVYASEVIERGVPSDIDYRTKEEILDVFDAPSSHAELGQMIDILVKAWFVTFRILLFSIKNEHQLLQSAWSIAQRVCFTAMRSALFAMR